LAFGLVLVLVLVLEKWGGSVGVLRQVGIAPRDREVGDAEGVEEDLLRMAGSINVRS